MATSRRPRQSRPSTPPPRRGATALRDGGDRGARGGADRGRQAGREQDQSGATTTVQRLGAEFLGTFVLVLVGCGAAVLAGATRTTTGTAVGIGYLGVAVAFGLSVLTMAYAVGPVSGGHFNPAVTVGLATARRFAWRDVPGYVVTQVVAAVAAATVLYAIADGRSGFSARASGFASNGYGSRSPAGYSTTACFVAEAVLAAVFLVVILGATDTRAPRGFAPLAIGLALTMIHLVAIPVTNTSVNPARSIGPALFAGRAAIGQLWLFVLAPLLGAVVAGGLYASLFGQVKGATSLQDTSEA